MKKYNINYIKIITNIFLVSLSIFLCSCAITTNKSIPLKEFMTSLSKDIACLEFCSSQNGAPLFAVNDPIDINLNIAYSNNIEADVSGSSYAIPVVVTAGTSKSNSGSLHMKLYLVNNYRLIKIITNDTTKKYKDVTLFNQIINNQEYLYIVGIEIENNKNYKIIKRIKMSNIKKIIILAPAKKQNINCKCKE